MLEFKRENIYIYIYIYKNDIYKEGIVILNESLEWAEECDGKYYVGYVAGVLGLINATTQNEE